MQVNEVIGIDLLGQSLMPAIENLADDTHWRVRLAIIQYIPLLATQLGADSFQRQLGQQCLRWLEDQVGSVQEDVLQHYVALYSSGKPQALWCRLILHADCCRSSAFVKQQHRIFRSWPLNLGPIGQRTTLYLRSASFYLNVSHKRHISCVGYDAWHNLRRTPEKLSMFVACRS